VKKVWTPLLTQCDNCLFVFLVNKFIFITNNPYQALIMAHEADMHYGHILHSTTGIIFLATPHRGSELVSWSLLFANIVNGTTLGHGLRKELLRGLDRKSDALLEVARQFVHRATGLKIMTFTETMVERPLTTLVSIYIHLTIAF
jgi:hypothetical protein